MREVALWLALVSCPAAIFGVFGMPGMDAFDDVGAVRTSGTASLGRLAFAQACSECHGRIAEGTVRAPGLIAAEFGARAMPDYVIEEILLNGKSHRGTLDGASNPFTSAQGDLEAALHYLRDAQRENGIR